MGQNSRYVCFFLNKNILTFLVPFKGIGWDSWGFQRVPQHVHSEVDGPDGCCELKKSSEVTGHHLFDGLVGRWFFTEQVSVGW